MRQMQIAEEILSVYHPPPRPRGIKNPFKRQTGCMVPLCEANMCDRQRKKICALRRYFLLIQKERRSMLEKHRRTASDKVIEILKKEIYFWRKK